MMRRTIHVAACVTACFVVHTALAAEETNLCPNPGFEESIEFHPKDWKKGLTVWRFYEITLPMKGGIDAGTRFKGKRSFRFQGTGKGFAHSGFFKVQADAKYRVTLSSKGVKPGVEVFWWKKEGVETEKVKFGKVALKKVAARNGWTTYTGEVASPPDARKAYVRTIATGNLWVDEVGFVKVK